MIHVFDFSSIFHLIPGSVGASVIFMLLFVALIKRFNYFRQCSKVPGPPAQIPIFGSITSLLLKSEDRMNHLVKQFKEYRELGSVFRVWVGPFPLFLLHTASAAKVLLSDGELIEKSREYQYLCPWLNTGLLTSSGRKWQARRKMLTPAFHFKILHDAVHVFNEQSAVLIQKLKTATMKQDSLNIYPYITRCTLDIICESAMGHNVNAQNDVDSEYVQSVYKITDVVQRRQLEPWLQPDWLFNLTESGKIHKRCLEVLHGFTDQVIKARKLEHVKYKEWKRDEKVEDVLFQKKRRLAFLDLLIEASDNGKYLSDADIREEVDTFMFEGHDTTAASITWALFLIASHPNVQEKVHEELARVFDDLDRPVTISDLSELKYLECCIKESLRLYPSVPFLGRKLSKTTDFDGYQLPSGSTVVLLTMFLHRDPCNFPDPDRFIPERFLPENCHGRHPYAYIPFSAGPRNCIGQKFAMMEEKIILSSILRNFHLKSLEEIKDVVLLIQLILRPRDGILLRLLPN